MSLRAALRARIQASGPVNLEDFMDMVLGHPVFGYYPTRDPLGAQGDFTTAPEISQIFGELIGLWAADVWMKMGRPDPVLLVECGPGRGTILADAMRAARVVPEFCKAIRIHLVETSPALRAHQAHTLRDFAPVWHDRPEDLPPGPMILIANEFLDALPVRQCVRTTSGWAERHVDLDGPEDFRFVLRPADPQTIEALPAPCRAAAPGEIVEFSPAREAFAKHLSARLVRSNGAALLIDYGHASSAPGDTLQAVRAHRFAPVLKDIGNADLTAHVDFARLAEGIHPTGVSIAPIVSQGAFLTALGGAARLEALSRKNPGQAESLQSAYRRLTAPNEMGDLFKVMAVWHGLDALPEGFS